MRTLLFRCDECGKEEPEVLLGWRKLSYSGTHAIEVEDTTDKDLCSWECLAKYAAKMTRMRVDYIEPGMIAVYRDPLDDSERS